MRRYYGYWLSRGAFTNTSDDVAGTWYVDPDDTDYLDRRGRGWPTLAEAKAEVRRRCSCHCGAGPFRTMLALLQHQAVHGNPHTGSEHLERLALVVERSLAEANDG